MISVRPYGDASCVRCGS